jgi:glycerophosphoryl diester phosphodiesterase
VKIIAHRGNSAHWPENTLAAFRSAWAAGADGIELDVRLTADRRVVVFHDEDGRRLCHDPRRLRDIQYADLQAWRVAPPLKPTPGGDTEAIAASDRCGERIPLLDEVLAENRSGRLVYVELKAGEALIDCMSPLPVEAVVLAFDPEVARAAKTLSVPAWLNVEAERVRDIHYVVDFVRGLGLDGVSLGYSDGISGVCVEQVHEAGLPLAVWTVNEVAVARRLEAWGVDVMMTDDPAAIRTGLRKGAS